MKFVAVTWENVNKYFYKALLDGVGLPSSFAFQIRRPLQIMKSHKLHKTAQMKSRWPTTGRLHHPSKSPNGDQQGRLH